MEHERLVIATDGSCLGNPGPGGWAWAADADNWASGSEAHTTNNLMELRAVFEAVSAVRPEVPLLIQADSEYAIKALTEWLPGWQARGWRTASKKPVSNRRGIEMIAALLSGRDVQWEHVRGHAGHPLNEFVDTKARAAATARRDGLAVHSGPRGIGAQSDG